MIPKYWAEDDYIVNSVLMEFCRNNKLRVTYTRAALVEAVNNFEKESEDNSIKVAEWLDIAMKQGIKHILFRRIEDDEKLKITKEKLNAELDLKFPNNRNKKLLYNVTEGNVINLQSINIKESEKIEFVYTINLCELKQETRKRFVYPIFVDLDLKNHNVIGRAKSKTNIYKVLSDNIDEIGSKTSTESLIRECIDDVVTKLEVEFYNKEKYISEMKKVIYNILEKYTFTPIKIQNQLDELDVYAERFVDETIDILGIDSITNKAKAKEDIKIFLEKYISINEKDKNIFIDDREAYPYKLVSTDREFTRVEETTSNFEPLQCKEKFFDNKKSIKMEEACDGLFLIYKQKNNMQRSYKVKIAVKGCYCSVRIESYVEEVDIENVLSSIIKFK